MSAPPSPPPPRPPRPQEKHRATHVTFRRRRAGAGLLAIVVVALAIAAVASHPARSGGAASHRARGADGQRGTDHARRSRTAPGPNPEQRRARLHAEEEGAIDRVLSYTPAVTAGGDHGDELALTFDDGPGPYTPRLVQTLNRLHVQATFFAIGEQEQYFSAGTLAELRAGDVVGDHTETHPMMALLSARQQREELFEQILHIEALGGPRPRLFRPPYGSFDATTLRELRELRLLMVLWSDDTSDYTKPGVAAIVQRALAGAHPGAIILMHDGGGDRSQTIAALPAIVAGLRRKGLRPVTIPRLLLDDPPPRGLPVPRSLAGD